MLWYSTTRVPEVPGFLVTNLACVPCLCSSACCNSGPCSHQLLRIALSLRMLSLMLIQILGHPEWHISPACVAFLSQSHSWSLLTLFQGFTLLVTTLKTGSKVDSPQVGPSLVGETEGNNGRVGAIGGLLDPIWGSRKQSVRWNGWRGGKQMRLKK